MIKNISSLQNPLVKKVVLLTQKSRARKQEGLFVMEGIREIERAHKAGFVLQTVLYNSFWQTEEMESFLPENIEKIVADETVFKKLAYRWGVKNVVAVAEVKNQKLEDLKDLENPLILVVENIEKPGNLGAMLRSADAAGVCAVVVCNQEMDIYNPNVLRNSLGGFFNLPVVQTTSSEAIEFLQAHGIQILTTFLEASKPYYEMDFKKPTAIVLGSEAEGVSKIWTDNSDQNIIIPMSGIVDSLNVSNAASIVMFEASRQRL